MTFTKSIFTHTHTKMFQLHFMYYIRYGNETIIGYFTKLIQTEYNNIKGYSSKKKTGTNVQMFATCAILTRRLTNRI